MFRFYAASICMLAMTCQLHAQLHSGDVILDIHDGKMVTGTVDGDGMPLFPWHVWTENFGSAGIPNFAADPGYDSLSGTFIPGHAVGLFINKALRVWDAEQGHFLDIASPETIEVSRFSNVITTPAEDPLPGETLPSLTLGVANASGLIHIHPNYTLTAPHSTGLYLLELRIWVSTEGVEPSDPFWIIFNQNESQEMVAEATQWVEDNLVEPLGCPADLNGDGVVNVSDLLVLLSAWGDNPGHAADLNGDGVVNVSDLLLLLGSWGACS
jgi:hypothetical protein